MATQEHYDAVVIGAGQAGGPLSSALARAGRKTALIESTHVGGTCINEGCTPTKTMIASGRVAYLVRREADYGVHSGPVRVDEGKVRERKRQIVQSFRSGSEQRLRETEGLDVLMGTATFTGPKTLQVRLQDGATREISAETIFVNTGERPAAPPLAGLEAVPALNSTTIMELDAVPEHLLVLGGGYVGLEFGQLFRRLGSAVTIVQRGPQLLPREDEDVATEVAKILHEDGITVFLETSAQRVRQREDGAIALTVQGQDGEQELAGSHLLVAAGRAPNVEELNPSAAGIASDKRGYITVDERLQTNVPGIYALGDVKGPPAFTHISYDDYRIIKANLLDGGSRSTSDRPVPYTVFIDPQLGRVGLSEKEARAQGRAVKIATMPMSHVARALEVDEPRGMMKALVDAQDGQILGCAILGLEGGEIMSMLQIAMMGRVPYTALRDAVFAHPTLAESLNNLFATIA